MKMNQDGIYVDSLFNNGVTKTTTNPQEYITYY